MILRIAIISFLVLAGYFFFRVFFSRPHYQQQGHVKIAELREGTGATVWQGAIATVIYVTRVKNGPVVSASKVEQPFSFVVGAQQVMPGWEEGLMGLREGGKRKILIPPAYAYGVQGAPPLVPPNATLEVELELVKLVHKAQK